MNFLIKPLFALVTLLCVTLTATAHGFNVGDLEIAHPYAIATVQGQSVGGVYFKHIANKGDKADRLISTAVASTVADKTELHTMNTENDVMRMREVTAIELPAKTTIPMTRGLKKDGYHIMLMGLKAPLKVGDKLAVKLKFERAGEVGVVVNVEPPKVNVSSVTHQH